jgi:hypothetical protein
MTRAVENAFYMKKEMLSLLSLKNTRQLQVDSLRLGIIVDKAAHN